MWVYIVYRRAPPREGVTQEFMTETRLGAGQLVAEAIRKGSTAAQEVGQGSLIDGVLGASAG